MFFYNYINAYLDGVLNSFSNISIVIERLLKSRSLHEVYLRAGIIFDEKSSYFLTLSKCH